MTQSRTKPTLDERIAAAFGEDAKSDEVAGLISEVETAALVAGEAADQARGRALDPTLSAADVATARRAMEDAAFKRDRMQAALAKLSERLNDLKHQEEEQRRWAAYEKATAERDALAAELKEVYPAFAERLADILARVEANDREIERINTRARPNGADWLATAELVARGLKGFSDGPTNVPRITRDLRLPAFDYRPNEDYAWPQTRR